MPRITTPSATVAAVLAGALALAGCSARELMGAGTDEPVATVDSSPTTLPGQLPTIAALECPPDAECILGFEMGGEVIEVVCNDVQPSVVTTSRLARNGADREFRDFSVIDGVDPNIAGAIWTTACIRHGWALAMRQPSRYDGSPAQRAMAVARSRCAVLVEPSEEDHCTDGGAAQWTDTSPTGDTYTRWATFDEYVTAIDAAVSADPTHPDAWRLDPLEVATRRLLEYFGTADGICAGDFYDRCRVVLESTPIDNGNTYAYSGVVQWVWRMDDVEQQFAQTIPFTIGVHHNGNTWWAIAYDEGRLVDHGPGADGVAAAEWYAHDCDLAIIEQDWPG